MNYFADRTVEPMAFQKHFEVTIPSDTAQGQAVQERIIALLQELEYPERDVFGVRLSLEEALVNAIKHGNQLDPDKNVRVCCDLNDDAVRITIEDEGPGFIPAEVPDPTCEENIEIPSGRGIMLMRAFMNLIEYNDVGNCVVMEKHRGVDVETDDD